MKGIEERSPGFLRRLGLIDTAFLVIGAVVGSGIFMTPGLVAEGLPSPGFALIVWFAGGLITLCGALTFAELGAMFPRAGGQYIYLREAYGPAASFLFGWGFFGFIMCGGLAALAVAFAEFLGGFIPALSTARVLWVINLPGLSHTVTAGQAVAASSIVMLTFLNTRGIRAGVAVQNLLTVLRLGAVAGLVILGGLLGEGAGAGNFRSLFPPGGPALSDLAGPLGLALVAVFWTYDGWYAVNCTAEEIREPARNIPRGLLLGVATVAVSYVLVNVVYLWALPFEEMKGVTRIGERAAAALFGAGGAALFSAVVMVSIFGCLNANLLYGPRVYYAMARDGSFFRSMGRLSERFRVPAGALWGQAVWASALCLSGTYQALYEYMVFALLLFFAATGAAVFVLRRRLPQAQRPYRTWGYPVVPLVFILMSLSVFVNIVLSQPLKALAGAALLGAGFPAYLWWRSRQRPRPSFPDKRGAQRPRNGIE